VKHNDVRSQKKNGGKVGNDVQSQKQNGKKMSDHCMKVKREVRSEGKMKKSCPISDFWWETSDLKKEMREKLEWKLEKQLESWRLWSEPCGARLAPGIKPLHLQRAQIMVIDMFVDDQSVISRILGGF